jgi:hypothetical protein
VHELEGENLWSWLENELPPYAKVHVNAALSGDKSAALGLFAAAPNKWRGWIARAAYCSGVPNPGFQEIIRHVWNHDHDQLLAAVRHRGVIRQMMKAAEFDHPFTGRVTVFRGAAGLSLMNASKGLSWTVSRDVACWFALRFSRNDCKPMVLRANIDAVDIVFWDNSRHEQEVVLTHARPAGLDPDPATWIQAADNHERETQQRNAQLMKRLKRKWQALKKTTKNHEQYSAPGGTPPGAPD